MQHVLGRVMSLCSHLVTTLENLSLLWHLLVPMPIQQHYHVNTHPAFILHPGGTLVLVSG